MSDPAAPDRPPYSRGTASRALAKERLRALRPGDGAVLPLPAARPDRRIALQRVNDMCRSLWGPGRYSVREAADGAVVMPRREGGG